jgi:hypothetical protein
MLYVIVYYTYRLNIVTSHHESCQNAECPNRKIHPSTPRQSYIWKIESLFIVVAFRGIWNPHECFFGYE